MHAFKSKLKINTITQLISFLVFAAIINQIALNLLLFTALILIAILMQTESQHFFRLIRRMKWFFIVMFFIFTFNTPGEHIQGWSYFLNPTYEGLLSGFLQVLRMLTLLAALSLIMAFNSRQQLISGFYFILSPLRYLGLEVERFAARLWLTLDYVESAQQLNKQEGFLEQLKAFKGFNSVQSADFNIAFKMPIFNALDVLVLCGLILISIYAFTKALI